MRIRIKQTAAAVLSAVLLGMAASAVTAEETDPDANPPLDQYTTQDIMKELGITADMTPEQIQAIIDKALPNAPGTKNEMPADNPLEGITQDMTKEQIDAILSERYPYNVTQEDQTVNPMEGITPEMTPNQIQDHINKTYPPMGGDNALGCKTLLCLSNPNGWRSVSECHPPVKEVFRRLRRHKPMPKCPQANEQQNRIDFVYNPYDPCSEMNLNDVTGYVADASAARRYHDAWRFSEQFAGHGTSYCGGNYVGSYTTCIQEDSEGYCMEWARVKVYDPLRTNPYHDPYSIDVTIEGTWRYRVHDDRY